MPSGVKRVNFFAKSEFLNFKVLRTPQGPRKITNMGPRGTHGDTKISTRVDKIVPGLKKSDLGILA